VPTFRFNVNDIPDGGMRGYASDDTKLLVLRDGDRVRAFEGACPHAGATLADGVRCKGRVVCPWHHGAFSVDDGGLLEPPAVNGLGAFAIERNGDVCTVDTEARLTTETISVVPESSAGAGPHVVIVGAGVGSFMAAQTLRQRGHRGLITMLAPEGTPPYDRTMLSKNFLADGGSPDELALGEGDWAETHGITLVSDSATALDRGKKEITLASGKSLRYDRLIVATGAEPTDGHLPGADLEGVHFLRSLVDSQSLHDAAGGKRVVIVGTGFIGMEAASALSGEHGAASVTVLGQGKQIMASVLGRDAAGALAARHAARGVDIHLGVEVKQLVGDGGRVTAVELADGTKVEADIVLLGLGVRPRTSLLADLADDDGALHADAQMRVAPDIQAIGDIALAPSVSGTLRVEHFRVAMQHGMVAANALLESTEGSDAGERVPFFWTMQVDKSLRYVGHASPGAGKHLWGSATDMTFIEFSFEGQRVVAVAGCGKDTELAAVEECLRLGVVLSEDAIRRGPFDLVAHLRSTVEA